MSRPAVPPADQAMLAAIDSVVPAHGRWQADEEIEGGYVCRMWSREDAVEAYRALVEDSSVRVSTSRDGDGRDWLWIEGATHAL